MFTTSDLLDLGSLVATTWRSAAGRDWSVPAGTLEWTCTQTADHAVDTVWAPVYFLDSRRTDSYPGWGVFSAGADATAAQLAEAVEAAARVLAAVVDGTPADVRAILFRRPEPVTAPPADFAPRGALELILHAHDVCAGLGVPFDPPAPLCARLRDHTRDWPYWGYWDGGLEFTDDPWRDLLRSTNRA